MTNRVLGAAWLITLAAACNAATDMPPSGQTEAMVPEEVSLPANIVAQRSGFIPEGIEY